MRNKTAKAIRSEVSIQGGNRNTYKNAKRIYLTQGLSIGDSVYLASIRYDKMHNQFYN